MKGVVGFLFFMLFLAGFAFVMLAGRQSSEQEAPAPNYDIANLYDREWQPTNLDGDAVPAGTDLFFMFSPDGEVTGYGGCNSFFGPVGDTEWLDPETEETQRGLKAGPFGATRKACDAAIMARELDFLRVLELSRTYLATPDSLEAVDQFGNVLGTFVAPDDL